MTDNDNNIDDLLEKANSDALVNNSNTEPEPKPEPENESEPEPELEPHNTEELENEPDEPSDGGDAQDEQDENDNTDEYGNKLDKLDNVDGDGHGNAGKTYTEEEVNERINKAVRERLARLERNGFQQQQQQQQQQPQPQQQQGDFEYDDNSTKDYAQQLEEFVQNTVSKMHKKQEQEQQQQVEQRAQQEFEQKFHNDMSRFSDFREVMQNQNITDPMVIATRAMKSPAAFLYAVVKQNPSEIERIGKIQDPYTQILEVGRLEERMKKNSKSTTKAPKPVSRTKESSSVNRKSKTTDSVDDLIAKSDAKRMKNMRR